MDFGLRVRGGLRFFAPGNGSFGGGNKLALVSDDRGGIVAKSRPLLGVGPSVFELQLAQFVDRRHRDPGVHGSQDGGLHRAVDPVREPTETLMQRRPVFGPRGDCERQRDRA